MLNSLHYQRHQLNEPCLKAGTEQTLPPQSPSLKSLSDEACIYEIKCSVLEGVTLPSLHSSINRTVSQLVRLHEAFNVLAEELHY